MSDKSKKQFGVWIDSHTAAIIEKEEINEADSIIIGHIKNIDPDANSNKKTSNNQEITLTQKHFKEIAYPMPNIDAIHITGTGQIQEQFMKFLAETPQYKIPISTESTSNRMSDENLAQFIAKHFN